MKKNLTPAVAWLVELLVLIGPTAGYSIYCYVDTLQYTMTPTSKGTFWTVISLTILAAIIFRIFKTKYERYQEEYVVMKADLRNHPNNPTGVQNVARAKTIIENLDYLVAAFPIAIAVTVLKAFEGAIDNLIIILEIAGMSLAGKIATHALFIEFQKKQTLGELAAKDEGGDE